MTAEEAIKKAKLLFHTNPGVGACRFEWDYAVEFKENPYRKKGEMWMVGCTDSDRVYAFVDEFSGDLLCTTLRKRGRSAIYNE